MLRELIGQALQSYGYNPILAESAAAALPILEDKALHVDLMLTDIVMPGMNGVELGTRVATLRPALKVLYMSGYAPEPKHRELFSRQGAAFIQKPFTPDELVAKLGALLATPRHA
jgi:DNA-binding NtrC family response regulator